MSRINLVRLQDGIPIYLWRRSISFLTVREQAVSVRGISRFFRECSDVYMENFWSEPTIRLPRDARSLARAMEMCQYLTRQEGYVKGTIVVVLLGSGVHEVVGNWINPDSGGGVRTRQKQLSVPCDNPCDNLSFAGKGEGKTIVVGSFVVENGRKVSIEGLTMKSSSPCGVVASGAGTEVVLQNVTILECLGNALGAEGGAKLVATDCQFRQNGGCGVIAIGSTTTVCLTNCTSHHNKRNGVGAYRGAVVDLMGEGTSVHDNKMYGLCAWDRGTTINVYQPCVLNDMSYENKDQNIDILRGGTVRQRDSNK